jgi:MFS family permease
MATKFHGWRITAAAFVTFGISVGLPYYNIGFFYDYFQRSFGWLRADVTLGFPLAALLTIWVGPVVIHRSSPRKLILAGTAFTAASLAGFACMGPRLGVYYALWVVYMLGYVTSGSVPHQLLISYWFRRNRGKAMAVLFAGVALWGSLGSLLVTWLTHRFDVRTTLVALSGLMFVTWPLALFVIKDRPRDVGQFPDGEKQAALDAAPKPAGLRELLRSRRFWLLLLGSACSIGAIGAVNFHMKFIFLDAGFAKGAAADSAWRTASVLILWSSIAGRLLMGALADRYSRELVMTADFFLVAATIPLLLTVQPTSALSLYVFAILFGFGMGADYMLIPLVAAEQFGVESLARVMGIVVPATVLGQSWFPYLVSILREWRGNYWWAMGAVLAVAVAGALAILALPRRSPAAVRNRTSAPTGYSATSAER